MQGLSFRRTALLLHHEINLPLDIITTRTAIEVWIDAKLSNGTPAVLHRAALPPYAHDHVIPVLLKYEHNGYRVVPVRDGVWVLSVVEKDRN